MKIQFTQQHIVRGETRDEDVVYEKDQVADFGKDRVANSYALAYIERGYAVEFDEGAEKARKKNDAEVAAKAAKLDARAKIAIPTDLSKLKDAEIIELGHSLSDEFVKNKDDAFKAIDAERARRNPT